MRSLLRSRIATFREVDLPTGYGKGVGEKVLVLGSDESVSDFVDRFHEDRSILI
jgi:hypothetical protein